MNILDSLRKLRESPYGGFKSSVIFFTWFVASEYLPYLINKDLGAFLWTSFHFIINPILGLILAILILEHFSRQKYIKFKALSLVSASIPALVCYIGFSGDIRVVELMGIKFN